MANTTRSRQLLNDAQNAVDAVAFGSMARDAGVVAVLAEEAEGCAGMLTEMSPITPRLN